MNFSSPDFSRRLQGVSPAYRQFLASHPTDSMIGELVMLYGFKQIEERNETYQVAVFIPDYISIGNDSGDYEFLLKRDGNEAVYREDPGCFSHPSFELVHLSFSIWIADGCPLPSEPEIPIPLEGCVWLLASPPAGMKDMFRLKAMLGEAWSVPQMKEYLAHTPTILPKQRHHYAIHRMLKRYPDFSDFRGVLGFSDTEESEKKGYALFADLL